MNEKEFRASALSDKINEVEQYLREYQNALRELENQLPDDGQLEPLQIAAAIGRLEVYPCSDAAVILTYIDDSEDIDIQVNEIVNKTAIEFLKESEIFAYYDEEGNPTSIRISFNEIEQNPNQFLHKEFNLDDVVVWSSNLGKGTKKDFDNNFFIPKFKKLSILGWETPLSKPMVKATKDIQKAYTYTNIFRLTIQGSTESIKGKKLLEVAEEYMTEFEQCLNSQQPNEKIKDFLKKHPEVINPSYLRCYKDIALSEALSADLLLLIWDEGLKWLLVKLEDVNTSFFSDSNQYSEKFINGRNLLSDMEKLVQQNASFSSLGLMALGTNEIHFVMGRTAYLNYRQKKRLREENNQKSHKFETYDDLGNKFKYFVRENAGIWDRYEPVQERLEKLGILNDADFNLTMELIDQELRQEEVSIPASSLEGWIRFSSVFGLSLTGRDPLSIKIYDWFKKKYGEDLKIDPTWKMAILIKESVYRLRLPLIYGTVHFICSPDQYGTTSGAIVSRDTPPTVNILDLIDNLTEEQAKSLDKKDLTNIVNQFQIGFGTMNDLKSLPEVEFTHEIKKKIENCVNHLLVKPIEVEALKNDLILAIEKLIEIFISQKKGEVEKIVELNDLVTKAESLGLRKIPRIALEKIQNLNMNNRGLPPDKNNREALEAYYIGLDLCSGVSSQIYLTNNYKPITELEPGKFYTNSLGKIYRCVDVNGDEAQIMLFDEVFGNTLDVLFSQNRNYWEQYYLIEDQSIIDSFEQRYRQIKKKEPNKPET